MRCDQSSSRAPQFGGNAEQFGDHDDRNRRRKMFEQIDRALRLEPVDQLVGQSVDARRKAFDLPRYEGAIDEIAQARVLGRLEFEQRMAFDIEERPQMGGRLAPAKFLAARHDEEFAARTADRAATPTLAHGARNTKIHIAPRKRSAPRREWRGRRDRDR